MHKSTPMARPGDHPEIKIGRIGVLIVNLGTPDATDYWSMRRYLKEFLWDKRVVEAPRLIWWPILNGVILSTRPQKSGKAYDSVWNRELDESPLRTITRDTSSKLATALKPHQQLIVDWAMRYGTPPITERMDNLQRQGCDRILVVPLYPQYSASTTATVVDKVNGHLAKLRWQPSVRFVPPYYSDPAYIDALADRMLASLTALEFEPDLVLASFHGIPQDYFDKGDPYYCHCAATTRLLREKLGWPDERLRMTFQSRFGPKQWLQPYTDKTVEALAREGVKKLAVVTPGFAADCLETIEEIGVENRDIFLGNGGEQFAALPCLNDSGEAIRLLEQLVGRELGGWL